MTSHVWCFHFISYAGAMSSVMSLQEENRVLQEELARLEDLLAHSRADRDELAIKYSAISERVRLKEFYHKCFTEDWMGRHT